MEAFGCEPERLARIDALDAVFTTAVRELALHPVGHTHWHQFPAPGGITGLCLLAESHLTVHTFPEHASACFNLFCCTPRRAWDWETQLRTLLGAQSVRVRELDRDYAPVSTTAPVTVP